MHNLKEIRKDFDAFKKAIEKRSVEVNFEKLKDLDIKNREFIQKKEALEKEKKKFQNQKMKHFMLNQKKSLLLLKKLQINKISLKQI